MKRTFLTSVLVLAWLCVAPLALAQSVDLKTYYAAADGKKQAELKTAMYKLITNHTVISYSDLFDAYRTSDLRADGTVRDWYSNVTRFNIDTDRAGSYSAEGDCFNREHSVPQSWFSKASPMKSDLVHVVPTDGYVNNRRGSFPFGETKGEVYKSANAYSKVGACTVSGYSGQVFEPNDEVKGDFARIYFYMVTCYENRISGWNGGTASQVFDGKTYPGLKDWTLQMFLRWAQQDPVDDIERARNEAVYKLQKNRNPFVDFPELAEYVWGSKTDVPFSVSGEEPEPPTPPTPPGPPVVPADSTLLLYQYFSTDFGDFEAVASDGSRSRVWSVDEHYGAKANAYTFGKTADDWLVSPSIDLTRMRGATLEFSHATGFNSAADASRMFEVLVSLDYDGRPADANWYPLEVVWPERPSDGYSAYVYSGQVSLNDYVGDHVRIAFRYRASAAQCWAWEIRNVTLKGKPLPDGVAAAPEAPSFRRIFDEQGRYLGHSLPPRRGVLVVREGQKTKKVIRR